MTTVEAERRGTRRQTRSLFEAGRLRCPRDKVLRDVLAYRVLELSAEFDEQLNVILRCPDCNHVFSPALSSAEMRAIEEQR